MTIQQAREAVNIHCDFVRKERPDYLFHCAVMHDGDSWGSVDLKEKEILKWISRGWHYMGSISFREVSRREGSLFLEFALNVIGEDVDDDADICRWLRGVAHAVIAEKTGKGPVRVRPSFYTQDALGLANRLDVDGCAHTYPFAKVGTA